MRYIIGLVKDKCKKITNKKITKWWVMEQVLDLLVAGSIYLALGKVISWIWIIVTLIMFGVFEKIKPKGGKRDGK